MKNNSIKIFIQDMTPAFIICIVLTAISACVDNSISAQTSYTRVLEEASVYIKDPKTHLCFMMLGTFNTITNVPCSPEVESYIEKHSNNLESQCKPGEK